MNELITEIEKSIGLPSNWKCYPEIYKKFEWIDEVSRLRDRILYLEKILDENWAYYDTEDSDM